MKHFGVILIFSQKEPKPAKAQSQKERKIEEGREFFFQVQKYSLVQAGLQAPLQVWCKKERR